MNRLVALYISFILLFLTPLFGLHLFFIFPIPEPSAGLLYPISVTLLDCILFYVCIVSFSMWYSLSLNKSS